jgi:hypothetical protein
MRLRPADRLRLRRAVDAVAGQIEPEPDDADGAARSGRENVARGLLPPRDVFGRVRVVGAGDARDDFQIASRREIGLVPGDGTRKDGDKPVRRVEHGDFEFRQGNRQNAGFGAARRARVVFRPHGQFRVDRRKIGNDELEAGPDRAPVDAGVDPLESAARQMAAFGFIPWCMHRTARRRKTASGGTTSPLRRFGNRRNKDIHWRFIKPSFAKRVYQ